MFRFFRQIRNNLVQQGRLKKYSMYAIGEIVLVVIGILIALQINNANEERLERQREAKHLRNLRADLEINIQELDKKLTVRRGRIESAERIIEYFEDRPLEDLEDFNYHNINVHTWQRFYQNNNTYQELINSGNLGIISNDKIKRSLMDLELLYMKMKADEDHMRFDFEGYVYAPFFDAVDIAPMTDNYIYTATGGAAGAQPALSRAAIEGLLGDVRYKNGFTLAIYMNRQINVALEEIRLGTSNLVTMIDQELAARR